MADRPHRTPNARRRPWRAVAALSLACAVAFGWIVPAGAHADLIATTPTHGSVVDDPPSQLVMTFTQEVTVAEGAIRVLDPKGAELDDVSYPEEGEEVRVTLGRPPAEKGTYTVDWKAVSSDGHPIRGAWVFHLQQESGGADVQLGTVGPSPLITAVRAIGRALTLGALFILVGQLLWSRLAYRRLLIRLARIGVATLIFVDLWSAVDGGATDPLVILRTATDSASTRYLVGLAILVAYAPFITSMPGFRTRTRGQVWSVAVLCAALMGHATVVPPELFGALATVVHVFAAALWLSGLVWVAGAAPGWAQRLAPVGLTDAQVDVADPLIRDQDADRLRAIAGQQAGDGDPGAPAPADPPELAEPSEQEPLAAQWLLLQRSVRFSNWGLGAVVALAATGTWMLLVRIGGPARLLASGYGLLGTAKVLVLAGLVVLAARNRYQLIPRLARAFPTLSPEGADSGEARRAAAALRKSIDGEMILLVVAIVLGGVLGATPPPNDAADSALSESLAGGLNSTVSQSADFGPYQVQLEVSPAGVGPNIAHVTVIDPTGPPPEDLTELTASFELPEADLGPLQPTGVELNDSHVIFEDVVLSSPGRWRIIVDARRNGTEFLRANFEVDIEG
ncbi:MAG: copper resistance protein CopC [Microthrixaceae bacterium]